MKKRGVLKISFFVFLTITFLFLLFYIQNVKSLYPTGTACSSNSECESNYCSSGYCAASSGTSSNCGNGACESGETYASCPSDCGGGGCNSCSTTCTSMCTSSAQCDSIGGKYCNYMCYYPSSSAPSTCGSSSQVCGNGACEGSETSSSCPSDCGSSTSSTCSSSNYWSCATESTCSSAGGKWCSGATATTNYCSCSTCTCPSTTCDSSNLWNCKTSSTCSSAGGYWCSSSSYCYSTASSCSSSSYICGSTNLGYCYDSTSCTNAGGKWCSTYCTTSTSTCPDTTSTYICSSSQIWNCYNENDCKGASGNWCGTYCSSSCPTCSSTQQWNCYTESDCNNAKGNWCKYVSSGGMTASASTGWCSSSTCPSTTCDKDHTWNCYDESSCKNTGANWCKSSGTATGAMSSGWCSTSTCPAYECSKDTTWYCYDESSCKNTGSQWCGTYCSSSCPVCSSTQMWNCYDETNCKTAGGNWCKNTYTGTYTAPATMASSGWCSSYSCPSTECDNNNLNNCDTQTKCTGVGGSWCSSNPSYPPVTYWCQTSNCPSYSCSKDSSWYCYDESSCKNTGANWCKSSGTATGAMSSGWCSTSTCPTCSSTQQWNCYNENDCKGASGNWCGTYCSSTECPKCSSTQIWNCYDETNCKTAGGKWCKNTYTGIYTAPATMASSGWCSSYDCPSMDCDRDHTWNCYTKDTCTNVGGQWCGTYCSSSCPVCSSTQPWNCDTQTSCSGAGGQWCGTYCSSSCPTCSSTQKWNCYTESDCKSASGEWCKNTYTTPATTMASSGWCSDSCPKCSSTQQWNCYNENDCKGASGNWCGTYCSSAECPKCSSTQMWNCFTKTDCSTAGGNWCSTWCSSYSCPSVCGNGICESGESSSYCSSDCGKTSTCPTSIDISFDKDKYNVNDNVKMKINVGVPNVLVDITVSAGSVNSGSSSFTSDSNGLISYSFTVSQSTPGGTYTLTAKTNVPGCTGVSVSKSVTINSKGYCGDKICGASETTTSCPNDCETYSGKLYCPSTKTCSDGKSVSCGEYMGGCHCAPCEFDPGKIPVGCTQMADSATGVLRITCDKSCPPAPQDIEVQKQKCINNGGNPEFKSDFSGCNYFQCDFTGGEQNFYTGPDRCFSEDEIEEISAKCTKIGLPAQIKVMGDCKIAGCSQRETTKNCPLILSSERKNIEADCKLQGLQTIKKFNENGCQILKCGTPDDCDKELPNSAYDQCSREGGELIVKKDVNDCITSTQCIHLKDDDDAVIEDITILPSKTDLIAAALKLLEAQIDMEKLTDQAASIKDYYDSKNDPSKDIWERVVSALETISKEIKNIKDDLQKLTEAESISKDDILSIKSSIKKLDVVFNNALFLMLSNSKESIVHNEEVAECKDAGAGDCFSRSLSICQQTTYNPDKDTIVQIKGLENGECVLDAKLDPTAGPPAGTIPGANPPYTMTCKIKDYALGAPSPETDIFPYCEGSLIEVIKLYKKSDTGISKEEDIEKEREKAEEEERSFTSPTGQVIAFLDENRGPRNCFGWQECTKLCEKEPYTCVGYIDAWLRKNSGPGGVRSFVEFNDYCSKNKKVCAEWMLSKGISLKNIEETKKQSKSAITTFAVRR